MSQSALSEIMNGNCNYIRWHDGKYQFLQTKWERKDFDPTEQLCTKIGGDWMDVAGTKKSQDESHSIAES
jgi:hypothetical protein